MRRKGRGGWDFIPSRHSVSDAEYVKGEREGERRGRKLDNCAGGMASAVPRPAIAHYTRYILESASIALAP
jgi:hypothetical protein